MERQIIKGFKIEYSEKEIPIVDNSLREFMGSVFEEFHKLEKLRGDSMNIILVSEDSTRIYHIVFYKSDNPMHTARFKSFMKKVCKLAEASNCLPDKLSIKMIATHTTYHPEMQDGEIYLGNDNYEGFKKVGWKTKRRGNIPYDIYGRDISHERDFHPMFVQRKELEDAGIDIRDLI